MFRYIIDKIVRILAKHKSVYDLPSIFYLNAGSGTALWQRRRALTYEEICSYISKDKLFNNYTDWYINEHEYINGRERFIRTISSYHDILNFMRNYKSYEKI